MDTSDMTSLLVMSGYSQKSLRFERHAFEILGNWRLGKMRFWNPPRVFGRALVFFCSAFFWWGAGPEADDSYQHTTSTMESECFMDTPFPYP